MSIREDIKKVIDKLSEEDLDAVMEYLRFVLEPEEVEPTEEEAEAVARGQTSSLARLSRVAAGLREHISNHA